MERPEYPGATDLEITMYVRWVTVDLARGIPTGRVRHGQVQWTRGWRRHVMKEELKKLG